MQGSKYHNHKKKTEDGVFDSSKELRRWAILKRMEEAGEISYLHRQVPYELVPTQKLVTPRKKKNGKYQRTEQAVTYYADFVYQKDGKTIVEDVKGMRLPEYVIKRKLLKHIYGIEIVEV